MAASATVSLLAQGALLRMAQWRADVIIRQRIQKSKQQRRRSTLPKGLSRGSANDWPRGMSESAHRMAKKAYGRSPRSCKTLRGSLIAHNLTQRKRRTIKARLRNEAR
jgi:hypothetical protein